MRPRPPWCATRTTGSATSVGTKAGERYVETETRLESALFLVGGVFWDESVDYPLPLGGVNYLDLDFKDTGTQIDVFFAGAFSAAGISDPQLFGSRWNGGANLNGLFFKARDELYREGVVVPEEESGDAPRRRIVFVGRPLATFLNIDLTYGLRPRTSAARRHGRATSCSPRTL